MASDSEQSVARRPVIIIITRCPVFSITANVSVPFISVYLYLTVMGPDAQFSTLFKKFVDLKTPPETEAEAQAMCVYVFCLHDDVKECVSVSAV